MDARKVLAGFAALALGIGVLASMANAAPLCGSKACRDEAAASGLTDNARRACRKSLISDCQAGLCSCTGGSPPCSCVCGDGLCGPSEDCSTCPQDCGLCPTTTTTTTIPCSLCFVTVTDQCVGPCSQQSDCGIEPNVLCLPVTEIQRIGITCECPTTTTTTSTCPTTTTLGIPDCGAGSFCGFPCRSGQACVDPGNGQCACAGPVLCGGTYATCGGTCPAGTSCTPRPVPPGCRSIGCDCQ